MPVHALGQTGCIHPVEKGSKSHTARFPIHTGFAYNSFTTYYTTAACRANTSNFILINSESWNCLLSFKSICNTLLDHLWMSQFLHAHLFIRGQDLGRNQKKGSVADTHFWLSHSSERVSSEYRTCAHPSNRIGPTPWNCHGVWPSGYQSAWNSYIFPLKRETKWEQ